MTKDYTEDNLANKDLHKRWHIILVISLATMVTLQCIVSSVWLGLKQKELVLQLQIEQTCLERIRENHTFWNCDDLFIKDLVPASVYDTEDSGAGRVKRDDRKKPRNRRWRNTRKRNKKPRSQKKKPQKMDGYHLVIDSAFSQPDSPKLRTKAGEPITFWKEDYTDKKRNKRFAKLQSDGSVKIEKKGLYYIYSQVTYYDRTGSWSHTIDINDNVHFKCIASEWGVDIDPDTKKFYNVVHQCYTGGTTFISKGHRVVIKSMYHNRTIHADSEVTFWGIAKLK